MPVKKPAGMALLLQVEADRAALAERERAARAAAAVEIGEAVLDAVGPGFILAELTALLRSVQRVGFSAAMQTLGATAPAGKPLRAGIVNGAANGGAVAAANGADHASA